MGGRWNWWMHVRWRRGWTKFLGPFAATCILDDRLLSGAIATNLMSGKAAPGLTRPPRHASRPPLERTPQAAHTVTARAGKSVVSVRLVCGR